MIQDPILSEMPLGENPTIPQEVPNAIPGWQKCLLCADYGATCNGASLGTFGNIASIRTFHKTIKKIRKIPLKAIANVATTISENTVNEYFSNVEKDYKVTTVMAIDAAISSICGNRVGLPPLDHACPTSSSEVRQQLAAADMKLAAAELRAAQSETDVDELRRRLTEVKGKHIAQLDQLQELHRNDTQWLKEDIRLWRRIALISMGIGLVLLTLLLVYFTWTHLA